MSPISGWEIEVICERNKHIERVREREDETRRWDKEKGREKE